MPQQSLYVDAQASRLTLKYETDPADPGADVYLSAIVENHRGKRLATASVKLSTTYLDELVPYLYECAWQTYLYGDPLKIQEAWSRSLGKYMASVAAQATREAL